MNCTLVVCSLLRSCYDMFNPDVDEYVIASTCQRGSECEQMHVRSICSGDNEMTGRFRGMAGHGGLRAHGTHAQGEGL
eukprot:1510485-Rhodomonas_salina.1